MNFKLIPELAKRVLLFAAIGGVSTSCLPRRPPRIEMLVGGDAGAPTIQLRSCGCREIGEPIRMISVFEVSGDSNAPNSLICRIGVNGAFGDFTFLTNFWQYPLVPEGYVMMTDSCPPLTAGRSYEIRVELVHGEMWQTFRLDEGEHTRLGKRCR